MSIVGRQNLRYQVSSMQHARPRLWTPTWQGGKVLCSKVTASAAARSCQVVARAAKRWALPLRFYSTNLGRCDCLIRQEGLCSWREGASGKDGWCISLEVI